MSDFAKTCSFAAAAVVLAVAAAVASIPRVSSVADFNDQGKPFFPAFTDADAATTLEVTEVDPTTATLRPFKVTKKDGRWVIPSHNGYPADAEDRLAKTAAQILGLNKDTIRSTRSDDHATLGVLDPLETKSALGAEGVGKRITLRDESGRVLADYILGKDVPNRPGMKFVRVPGQPRTYGVAVKAEPSTRFGDWIEPNLLGIDAASVREVLIDNQKVDEARRTLIPGEIVRLSRAEDGAPWTTPGLEPDEELDPAKMAAMMRTLSDLRIVGVRPKPEGLVKYLDGQSNTLDARSQRSLEANGFHLSPKGQLISGEGSELLGLADGVRVTLRFGRVTFARGEALSAGTKSEDDSTPKEEPKEPGAVESRYLFADASFDPKLIPPPKALPPAETKPGEFPANVFETTTAERQAQATRAKFEADAYQRRLKDGQAKAEALAKRFSPWYYLVPGDAYRTLILDRASLVHVKPPPGARPPGGNPFGAGNLPPGFPPPGMPMPSPHGR